MNIKDISGIGGPRPVDASRGNEQAPGKTPEKPSTDATGRSDQLTLTSAGQYLAEAAGEPAPVDRDRIEAIREALANGTYEIDSSRIAGKLLKLDRDLV